MFDFAWSEIALIGVVALIAIGPKDLPVAIKAVAEMVKKARRMAGEFQTHVDEMVREANLSEVRDQFNDLRRMDVKGKILNAVDGDRTIRTTLSEPLITPNDFSPSPPPVPVHDVAPLAEAVIEAPAEVVEPYAAPAWLPPSAAKLGHPAHREPPPAWVPPAAAARRGTLGRAA